MKSSFLASGLIAIGLCAGIAPSAMAQTTSAPARASAPARPVGFVVPEWKSKDGQFIIRGRGRATHDFYSVSRNFDAGTINGDSENNDLRALRLGVDGQFTSKIKFRADANLTASQVNWSDVYVGYTGSKYEAFIGQNYIAAPLEFSVPDINFPLPEASLVGSAFGQGQRNFGVLGRVKGADWQVIGGVYSGNINAGDVFGDDVLRYVQVRGTYSPRHKDRDVIQFGGSVRVRDAQAGPLLRYSVRPAATSFGPRTLDSGAIATGDTTLSLEGLFMRGSLLVTGEHQVLWADTARGTAAMNGTYLEVCYWLTGENRRYNVGSGNVGQVKPKKSIRLGGPGALALVGRLERLDQNDALLGTRAGRVDAATLGLAWTPVEFVMLRLAGSENRYSGPNPARNGTARAVTARLQFAF
jgi:phosphate-selective porin OprO and OprP